MRKYGMPRRAIAAALFSAALLAAAATGCHSTPPPKPLDQLTEAESLGHSVFATRCAACHYDRINQPLHGPALLGVYKKPYLPSGAPANDERVTATILHGRNMMPAQQNVDGADLTNLLAYLHTL